MRAGEQLRFAEHAKLCFSAPQPSSAPFGGTFPEGKVWGACDLPVRQNPLLRSALSAFIRQCRFVQHLGFPSGKLAAERQRSRLMRAGEQLPFAWNAKLFASAPRPSSAPFGGTCPYPLCPFGTFPPDRGNRPRGEGKGCLPPCGASGIRQRALTSSLFTITSNRLAVLFSLPLPLHRLWQGGSLR